MEESSSSRPQRGAQPQSLRSPRLCSAQVLDDESVLDGSRGEATAEPSEAPEPQLPKAADRFSEMDVKGPALLQKGAPSRHKRG